MPGGKPFQSKLIPFYEQIARLRKKHTPYPQIAKLLRDEHRLEVAASTIFEFVKVRARRSGVFTLPEVPTAAPIPAPSPVATGEAHAAPQAQAKAARTGGRRRQQKKHAAGDAGSGSQKARCHGQAAAPIPPP